MWLDHILFHELFVSSTTNFDMSSCFRASQYIKFAAHCTSFLIYYIELIKDSLPNKIMLIQCPEKHGIERWTPVGRLYINYKVWKVYVEEYDVVEPSSRNNQSQTTHLEVTFNTQNPQRNFTILLLKCHIYTWNQL